MKQKLELELQDVERLKKDLEAQKVVRCEDKREWVPESRKWVESHKRHGGQWDEDTSGYEITPAHWTVGQIPIYEPDIEKQKKARQELARLSRNSEFFSVKYMIASKEDKWIPISKGLRKLDEEVDLDDAIKLLEVSKNKRIKKRLVEMSKSHAYLETRKCIRCRLRESFEKNELKDKDRYEGLLEKIGYLGGCFGSILGTATGYFAFPEFKEFMSSWGLVKGVGIITLATNGLGRGGRIIGRKLDEKRADRQYKEWLKR